MEEKEYSKSFEITVLTELASIKQMLSNYANVEKDSQEALAKSKENEKEIYEIKDKMKWLSRTIGVALIGLIVEIIVFVIKMM